MKIFLIFAPVLMISNIVFADRISQVHFKGNFLNAPCVVSSDTQNQIIDLGQYRTAEIVQSAQYTAHVPFEIRLVNCDIKLAETARFSFIGERDSIDPTLLLIKSDKQSTNAQTAKGIGLEIVDANGLTLSPNGVVYSEIKALKNGINTFMFSARYKSTSDDVQPGQANASANFLIDYQ